MTVETSDRKQTFSGGQGSLAFAFRTLASNPEYIKVLVKLLSTGAESVLTYSTDYTVAVNSDGVGGTVTVLPTFSTAYNYVVYRETEAVQDSDYDDFNQFPADTLENDLDRTILIAQEQEENTSRTLRYPISSSATDASLPSPEANAFIGWNSSGTALENKDLPDPNILQKASNLDATTATDDSNYMTAAKVKLEIENPGTVSLPVANIPVVTVTKGGTAISVYTQGDIIYASATTTLSKLGKNTSSTRYLSNTGTDNNPAWAQVDLTTGVSSALPIANGGTGQTTAQAAVDALLPSQTSNSGKFLTTNGSASSWGSVSITSKSAIAGGANVGGSSENEINLSGTNKTTSSNGANAVGFPFACTIKNLYFRCETANSNTIACAIQVNGSSSALTTTIASNGTNNADTTHSVSVSAGDLLNIRVDNSRSGAVNVNWCFEVDAT